MIVFDEKTGQALRVVKCQESAAGIQAGPGEAWVYGEGRPNEIYVDLSDPDKPKLAHRHPFVHAVTVAGLGATISNMPKSCFVWLDGVRYDVPDGTLEIEFDLPGRYSLTLEHPHYMTATVDLVI